MMANTYSQIYIQVVFAVQGQENLIKNEWRDELYKYITGIIKNHEQKLIVIGGISNHIHISLGIKPNVALSDLVREIKANSSRFVNERKFVKGKFYWQEGFGAFSYSHSQLDTVIRYIENQEIHHAQKSFKDEYKGFLKNFRVEHDEKYLFEWLE
jgi:REP element-mobilizing transposase RayT